MLGFIAWLFVVISAAGILALILTSFYLLNRPKPIITEHKLADGDYEAGDRPRPCPRCGGWTAIYLKNSDMDKCMDCGLIHR